MPQQLWQTTAGRTGPGFALAVLQKLVDPFGDAKGLVVVADLGLIVLDGGWVLPVARRMSMARQGHRPQPQPSPTGTPVRRLVRAVGTILATGCPGQVRPAGSRESGRAGW